MNRPVAVHTDEVALFERTADALTALRADRDEARARAERRAGLLREVHVADYWAGTEQGKAWERRIRAELGDDA